MWRLGDDAVRVVAGAGGVAVDEDVGSRLGLDGDGGRDDADILFAWRGESDFLGW